MVDMTIIQTVYLKNGFDEMKKVFPEFLREFGIEYEYNLQGRGITPIEPDKKETDTQNKFFTSIIDSTINCSGRVMSDVTRTYGYIAKLKATKSRMQDQKNVEQKNRISKSSSNDELERA